MRSRKATQELLKRQNRRLVLQALYAGDTNTRVGLAALTGLTKPTVSSLIAELLEEGLVREEGRGRSSDQGGKRPTLLAFRSDARQVIGIAVEQERVVGTLSDLAGRVSALHERALPSVGEAAVLEAVASVADGLLPQLDAPLMCLGVALPGKVDTASGTIRHSAALELAGFPLGPRLADDFGVPVHAGNHAELCALGQLAFGPHDREHPRTLVTLVLDNSPELGVCTDGGAGHHGSELAGPLLDELELDWPSIKHLVRTLRTAHPGTRLPEAGTRYLQVRYEAARGDPAARELTHVLAARLARLCAWVLLVLQPDQLSLAGGITELGDGFLELLRAQTAALLGEGATEHLGLSMAYSPHLASMGAVALALQRELELLT